MTLLRHLEDLEKAIKFRHPRMIVVKIATDAATGKHTADGEAALAAIKQQHCCHRRRSSGRYCRLQRWR